MPRSSVNVRFNRDSTYPYSSESAVDGSGTDPAISNSAPLWTNRVASPPSSRIMFGPEVPVSGSAEGQRSACSVHHQYSSRVSPFHAKTGTPLGASGVPVGPTATAAAAWSWVEKMLHDAQRTCAPRVVSVSMSTAVWMVMCNDPVMRAPASGLESPYSARSAMSPGISCSASWISLRPNAARPRSATLKSIEPSSDAVSVGVMRKSPVWSGGCCNRSVDREAFFDVVEDRHRSRVDS